MDRMYVTTDGLGRGVEEGVPTGDGDRKGVAAGEADGAGKEEYMGESEAETGAEGLRDASGLDTRDSDTVGACVLVADGRADGLADGAVATQAHSEELRPYTHAAWLSCGTHSPPSAEPLPAATKGQDAAWDWFSSANTPTGPLLTYVRVWPEEK